MVKRVTRKPGDTMQPTRPQRQPQPDRTPRTSNDVREKQPTNRGRALVPPTFPRTPGVAGTRNDVAEPSQATTGPNTPERQAANIGRAEALGQPPTPGGGQQPPQIVPEAKKVDPLYPPPAGTQSGASSLGPITPTPLAVPAPTYTAREIVAYQSSMLYGNYDFPRYNPDGLVGKKGLTIYEDMMVDEQVKAVMHFKRDAITARKWTFRYDDDSPLDEDEKQRRIGIMTALVNRLEGSFIDAMNYIMIGQQYGYSLTEKIYDFTEIEGENWYYVAKVQSKPLKTFYFVADQYGNLTQFYQLIGGFKNFLDIRKFVYYVHQPEHDWLFGRSELRAAYRSWFSKDVIIKLWNLWMERMAGGFITVEKAPDAQTVVPGTPEYAALQAAVSNLTTTTSLILPSGYTVKLISPNNTDQFERALVWHNTGIARSQLVPNLLGVTEGGGAGGHSALAQSQTQLEAFMWTLSNYAARLEQVLQSQWFNEIADYNFGDGEYPVFKFTPISDAQLQWIISQWAGLAQAGAVHLTPSDEIHLRKILDFPGITEDEIEEMDQQAKQDQMDTINATAKAKAAVAGPQKDKNDPAGIKAQAPGVAQTYARAATKSGKPRSCSVAAFTAAVQRVQFSVIENRTNMISEAAHNNAAKAVANALARKLKPEELALAMKEPQFIGNFSLDGTDIGRIKAAFKQPLQHGWNLGKDQSRREMKVAKPKHKFASGVDDAAAYIEANGMRMAGNLTDGAKAIIQQELLNGVKGDRTPSEVRDAITLRLVRKGFTDLKAISDSAMADTLEALRERLGGDYPGDQAAYLDTLIRTNVFEAFNEARYSTFTDPDLGDFVKALEYSAVLDDRTTEICESLDGATWTTDNDLWDKYRPPNHYNCRSILIPVTAVDGWDGDESPEPDVEPMDGFGRGEK